MDFTKSVASVPCCTYDVADEVVEISLDVIDTAVANNPFGAKCSANVEGTTAVTIGMTVGMEVSFAFFNVSFSFIKVSVWLSISLI